jgi:glucan phosphoethanolaminetransferase (alkaline phosphatase superfamily)
MKTKRSEHYFNSKQRLSIRWFYNLIAPRAYSIIVFCALFCTLAVKLFHSRRYGLLNEYPGWIFNDISVLLGIEVVLALTCFLWPRRWIIRSATVIAAIVCTWSVMNAAWLIRTGTQILPAELLPLIRDPVNILWIIGINLIKMPKAAVILLGPSAIALVFFFSVLAKPLQPHYNHKIFLSRIIVFTIIIVISASARSYVGRRSSPQVASIGLHYNSQLRAITSLVFRSSGHLARADFDKATRQIPAFDEVKLTLKPQVINHNIIIVVLEGIQYAYTSLSHRGNNLTPYLADLTRQGAEFTNARSTVSHTTKALFALLTGRFPSASQDIGETIPVEKPYASIATILRNQMSFRTAFFQSAKGNFESRPGLIHNLGFDKFWARDNLNDPNCYVGYLGCDEFSMLKPITDWIENDNRPFLITVLCSVTHDPYEVPKWFAASAEEPVDSYKQAIFYTDKFLAALDVEITRLNITDNTILCIIGDHGEAFGEHGLLGHERIAFDEVLHIPWIMRAPYLVEPGTKITIPVSSVDLTPTLLNLLGMNIGNADFDGTDVLGNVPEDRMVYFSGWMQQGPAGFVKGNQKVTYAPANNSVYIYNLADDPFELVRIEVPEKRAKTIADEIIAWRKNSIFRINQTRTGQKILFDSWLCRWNGRVNSVKYQKPQ